MNGDKNEKAAKHIEEELCIAGKNVAFEVMCMLDVCEEAVINRVLEIIDMETSDPSSGEDGDEPMSYAAGWMACGFLIKDKVLALKCGEQE